MLEHLASGEVLEHSNPNPNSNPNPRAPQVLEMLANAFGSTKTETGHKLLPPYIRVIQVRAHPNPKPSPEPSPHSSP